MPGDPPDGNDTMAQAPGEIMSNGDCTQVNVNLTFETAKAKTGATTAAAAMGGSSNSNGSSSSSSSSRNNVPPEAGVSANVSRRDSSGAMSPGNDNVMGRGSAAGGGGGGGAGPSQGSLDSVMEGEVLRTADEEYYAQAAFEAMSGQSTPAMLRLGNCYMQGRGIRQDMETGVDWIRRAAKLGDPDALNAMGELWDDGDLEECGFHVDKAKAIKYYRRAAECGSREAMLNLGLAYVEGVEVPRDGLEACLWLSKASHLGSSRAQAALGSLYLSGAEGLDPEPASGVFYLRSAVRAGNPEAALTLGECYRSGLGTNKDRSKAEDLFGVAADAGVTEALFALGTMKEDGDAEDQDDAWRYFAVGAAMGHQGCQEALEQLRETRSPPPPKQTKGQKAAVAAAVAASGSRRPPLAPTSPKEAAAPAATAPAATAPAATASAAAAAAAAVAASAQSVTFEEEGRSPNESALFETTMSTIGELIDDHHHDLAALPERVSAVNLAATSTSSPSVLRKSLSLSRGEHEYKTQIQRPPRRSHDPAPDEKSPKRRNNSMMNLMSSIKNGLSSSSRRSSLVGPVSGMLGTENLQSQYLYMDNYRLQKELELTRRKLSSVYKLSHSMDNMVQRFTLRIMALEDQVRALGVEPIVPPEAATESAIPGTPVASVPLTDPRLKRLFSNASPRGSPRSPRTFSMRSPFSLSRRVS